MRRLRKLDVGVGNHLDAVAPGIDEIKKRPIHQFGTCRLGETLHRRAVIDHKAEMPLAVLVRRLHLHQRQKLVAHVDEGLSLAAPAQRELKELALNGEGLVEVADLERDVIVADQTGVGGHGCIRDRSCVFNVGIP
jgi:hypothetical protein